MSIFGRTTYSAAGYATFRPVYPQSLFRRVLAFHNPPTNSGTLLDLGCGHGLIARELSSRFARVVGLDPSPGMIAQATELTKDPKITFRRGVAHDLSFLRDGSVDLVVAGQAAHWFDYAKTWPELARVVKPGGSLAFWGYKDNILVGYPKANQIFDRFAYGQGEVAPGMESMERYWEKPGRDIIRNSLADVRPPAADWIEVAREVYDPDRETSTVGDGEAPWLRRKMTLGEFEGYVRTFSSYQGWKDAHPDEASRAEGGDGDVIDVMFDTILEAVPEWKIKGLEWREIDVEAVWGTALILARRT